MKNTITKKLSKIIYTKDLGHTRKVTATYIIHDYTETDIRDIKNIRELKIAELVDDDDNYEKIKILEETPFIDRTDRTGIAEITMMCNIVKLTTNKHIDVIDFNYVNNFLKREILTEIYSISENNRKIIKVTKNIDFDIDVSNDITMEDKKIRLLSKILIVSNYIAVQIRIGAGNTIITNSYYSHILGDIPGIDFIIDDDLEDKIIVYRRNNKIEEIQNSVIFTYYYDNKLNKLYYSINKIGKCYSNYFEICITGFDI